MAKNGKALVWDVSVVSTIMADFYLHAASTGGVEVAKLAAVRKIYKYSTFVHFSAFENLGPIDADALSFLEDLGRRISGQSGDTMETAFLFQRVFVTIHRFNSVFSQSLMFYFFNRLDA